MDDAPNNVFSDVVIETGDDRDEEGGAPSTTSPDDGDEMDDDALG